MIIRCNIDVLGHCFHEPFDMILTLILTKGISYAL